MTGTAASSRVSGARGAERLGRSIGGLTSFATGQGVVQRFGDEAFSQDSPRC